MDNDLKFNALKLFKFVRAVDENQLILECEEHGDEIRTITFNCRPDGSLVAFSTFRGVNTAETVLTSDMSLAFTLWLMTVGYKGNNK